MVISEKLVIIALYHEHRSYAKLTSELNLSLYD